MKTLSRLSMILGGLLLLTVGYLYPVHAQPVTYSPEVLQIIENSRANNAFWSVVVRDSTGQILEGYNHKKMVRPASNLKLLTSAAILDKLGPSYKFKTRMYGVGHQEGKTWKGDIVIRGSGDPSIGGRFYENDRFHVFERFYRVLDSLGIRRIEGDLLGNTSFFDDEPYPKGWSWDDLSFYYGVEIRALSFNENAVDLEVFADNEVGERPDIQWFPFDTDYVNFINEQVITPPNSEYDEYYRRIPGTNTIILRSKLPENYYEEESLSIMNAPMFFMDTFKKYLDDGGIELEGRVLIDNQPKDWKSGKYKTLMIQRSPPVGELVQEINKESSNFYTEMLLKTAAANHYNTRGSTELGIALVKEFAAEAGMDTTKIEMTDGSGMSPATLLSLEDLSRLLVTLQQYSYYDVYRKSLAVAGRDGSLEKRFLNSSLEGQMRGKTGYVSGVRALSGYMEAASGRALIYCVATNNYTEKISYIDAIQEKILDQVFEKY